MASQTKCSTKEELQSMKIDLAILKKDVSTVKETLIEIKNEMPKWTKAMYTLYGENGDEGLVKKVHTIQQDVEDLKGWKLKVVTITSVLSSALAFIATLVKDYIFK